MPDLFRSTARASSVLPATGGVKRAEGQAKSVIRIILPGGLAHQESWDPKPEAPIEYRGPLGVVKTKIPGVVFSENLSHSAQIADKITVVRSIAGRIPITPKLPTRCSRVTFRHPPSSTPRSAP